VRSGAARQGGQGKVRRGKVCQGGQGKVGHGAASFGKAV